MKRTLVLGALVGAALLVAAVAGCGGHAKTTSLKLVADSGGGSKAVFHLRCDPAGGNIAHPARACAALKEHPDVLFHPKPFMCGFESWTLTISGRFEGRPVNVNTTTCWTPQMELIDRLGIAYQLVTHYVSYGTPLSMLSKTLDIPAKTPAWLIALADQHTPLLGVPDRMRIRQHEDADVIRLWGHFEYWDSCVIRRHAESTGACTRILVHGIRYARIKVDPKTRTVVGVEMK